MQYSNLFVERGFYNVGLKQYEKAYEDFILVIEADSNNLYANLGMAFYWKQENNLNEMEKYINVSLKLDTLNALVYNLRLGGYNNVNKNSMLADINKSINLSKTFNNSYAKRVMCYGAMDSINKAKDDLNYIIDKTPNNPQYYILRIIISEISENYEEIINDYTKLMEIDPETKIGSLSERAKFYSKIGKLNNAISDLKKIEMLNIEEGTFNYFEISGLYAEHSKTDSCLIYAKKAYEKGGKTKADFENDNRFSKIVKLKEFQEKIKK